MFSSGAKRNNTNVSIETVIITSNTGNIWLYNPPKEHTSYIKNGNKLAKTKQNITFTQIKRKEKQGGGSTSNNIYADHEVQEQWEPSGGLPTLTASQALPSGTFVLFPAGCSLGLIMSWASWISCCFPESMTSEH